MKRSVKLLLTALAVYLLLLLLLLGAEAAAPSSTIRTFGDALWYSLITMTTVGYGDLSPVTPFGRVLGAVFALCSVGILTALIGLGLKLIGGEWLPRLRLRFGRDRRWYAFSIENEDSAALADALRAEDPDCLLIFPAGDKRVSGASGPVRLNLRVPELKELRGGAEGLTVFWMGPEPQENYLRGLETCQAGIACCCMAELAPAFPDRMQLFSPGEAMSRCYWQEHPLKGSERCVVMILSGASGAALLERALLTNVFEAGRTVSYHVFGDMEDFAALHREIVHALDGSDPQEDRLCFHAESWTQAHALLAEADRVVVCMDTDAEGFQVCETLRRWYVCPRALHVRLSEKVPGLTCFGSRSESLRPKFVLKDELNRRARLMNDIYNENAAHPTPWEELDYFLRQSNITAADHLIVKARYLLGEEDLTELTAADCARAYARFCEIRAEQADLLQEMEHRRWLRFNRMYNWQYAPERDKARRLHPLLVPYAELSGDEQRKDAYAWEMLGRIAEKGEATEE